MYTRRVTCRCGQSYTVKTVRIRVYHPEHVRAVEVQRPPATRTRPESLPLAADPVASTGQALGMGADNPFQYLFVPPPTPPAAFGGTDRTEGDSSWWSWPW